MGTATSPSVVIRGHDPTALKDLFVWMQTSTANGSIQSLADSVSNDPVRHILALSCVRALGIRTIDHEISIIAKRLEQYDLKCDQVTRLMATQSLLSELRQPIIHHIARQFCLGALLDLNGYLMLGRLNPGFDKEVALKLRELREKKWNYKAQIAEGIWICKSLDDFRSKLVGNTGQQQIGPRQEQSCAQASVPPPNSAQAPIPQHAAMPFRQNPNHQRPAQIQSVQATAQCPVMPPNHPIVAPTISQPAAVFPPQAHSHMPHAYLMNQSLAESHHYGQQHIAQNPYAYVAQNSYSHAAMPVNHAAMYPAYAYPHAQAPMLPQAYPVYDPVAAHYQQAYAAQHHAPQAAAPLVYTTDESATHRPKSPRPRREKSQRRRTSTSVRDNNTHVDSDQPMESSDDQAYHNQRRQRRSSSYRYNDSPKQRRTSTAKGSFWQHVSKNNN